MNNENLTKAYNLLVNNDYNSVFPVVEYQTPIQRALKLEKDKIIPRQPEFKNSRSQDLEKFYHDAGQFYWVECTKILIDENIFTNNSGCLIVDELHAHDIDNLIDWEIAELKYNLINKKYENKIL